MPNNDQFFLDHGGYLNFVADDELLFVKKEKCLNKFGISELESQLECNNEIFVPYFRFHVLE